MITWINCSERMPPDDESWIIIVDEYPFRIRRGWIFNKLYSGNLDNCKWHPYTEEAWRKLSKS